MLARALAATSRSIRKKKEVESQVKPTFFRTALWVGRQKQEREKAHKNLSLSLSWEGIQTGGAPPRKEKSRRSPSNGHAKRPVSPRTAEDQQADHLWSIYIYSAIGLYTYKRASWIAVRLVRCYYFFFFRHWTEEVICALERRASSVWLFFFSVGVADILLRWVGMLCERFWIFAPPALRRQRDEKVVLRLNFEYSKAILAISVWKLKKMGYSLLKYIFMALKFIILTVT